MKSRMESNMSSPVVIGVDIWPVRPGTAIGQRTATTSTANAASARSIGASASCRRGWPPHRARVAISVSVFDSMLEHEPERAGSPPRHARLLVEIVGFRRPLQASSELFSWRCRVASRPIRENAIFERKRAHSA